MNYGYTPPVPADDNSPLTEDELRDAMCLQIGDPEIFFAEKGATYRDAELVCSNCPIAARCLAANLDEEYGFYAASPPARRRIARQLEKKQQPMTLGEFWASEAVA